MSQKDKLRMNFPMFFENQEMMACVSEGQEKSGFSIIWKIENFSFYGGKEGHFLRTPEFPVDTLESTKWILWLSPKSTAYIDHIACYLEKVSSKTEFRFLKCKYELSFLGFDGSSLKSKTFSGFDIKNSNYSPPLIAKKDEVFRYKRDKFLSQDILTIQCKIWQAEEFSCEEAECFIRTQIEVEHTAFILELNKFSQFTPSEETACIGDLPNGNLSISFGMRMTEDEVIYIQLIPLRYKNMQVCKCKLLLLNALGKEVNFGEHEFSCFNKALQEAWKIPLPLSKSNLINLKEIYLRNDTLTFKCLIFLSTGIESSKIEKSQFASGNIQEPIQNKVFNDEKCLPEISLLSTSILSRKSVANDTKEFTECKKIDLPKYVVNLSEKLQDMTIQYTKNFQQPSYTSLSWKEELISLYKDQKLCDIILRTKTKEFSVHSLILKIRSSLLRDEIDNIVKKGKDNCISSIPIINLQDLEADIVDQMLMFLYTDCIDMLEWKRAKKIYIAADTYQILPLKEICLFFLLQNLSPVNCCEILLLAVKYRDKDLKEGVQHYITEHNKEIIDGNQWCNLEKSNPFLAIETFHIILQYCQKS